MESGDVCAGLDTSIAPIVVQATNAPVVTFVDSSPVKTAEGARAFSRFIESALGRILDQSDEQVV